jgi:hypothetical protein
MLYNLDINEKSKLDLDKIKAKFDMAFECLIEIKTRGEKEVKQLTLPIFDEEFSNRIKRSKPKVVNISKDIVGGISE